MSLSNISDVVLRDIPTHTDSRGALSVIQGSSDIPFEISRVFYTYSTNVSISRGSHAHKSCWQALICLTGYLEVEVDDAQVKQVYSLRSPSKVLIIPPGIWSKQFNFSDKTVCLVLASEVYSPKEYLHEYTDFINFRSA